MNEKELSDSMAQGGLLVVLTLGGPLVFVVGYGVVILMVGLVVLAAAEYLLFVVGRSLVWLCRRGGPELMPDSDSIWRMVFAQIIGVVAGFVLGGCFFATLHSTLVEIPIQQAMFGGAAAGFLAASVWAITRDT